MRKKQFLQWARPASPPQLYFVMTGLRRGVPDGKGLRLKLIALYAHETNDLASEADCRVYLFPFYIDCAQVSCRPIPLM